MTDTDAKKSPVSPSAPPPSGKAMTTTATNGRVRSGLALIFSVVALMACGYLWYSLLYQNADLYSMDITGSLDRIESESSQIQDVLATTGKDIKTLKETQDTIRASLEKINTDLSRNRLEWALTETEQLLVIANNRLQLARDTHSALAALHAADMQLQQLASPKLLPVRRELAREITLLESLDKTDISGIALRLATIADAVDRLPLAQEMQFHPEATLNSPVISDNPGMAAAEGGWRESIRSLWRDILSLIRFRDNLETQRPLLPPEQQYFLRENLRLMLYGAQQAMLQGSVLTYQQNLKTAQNLLKDYFDVNSQIIIAMQNEIGKLQTAKVLTELPDISTSLTTLRRLSGRKAEP